MIMIKNTKKKHDNKTIKQNNGEYLVKLCDEKSKCLSFSLTVFISEVELIVKVIDALSCWTAHVLVMML